jgi:crotonobetainyl-CoA:carnitine CoA-transferase CaiB-like acyl-CoA transferase
MIKIEPPQDEPLRRRALPGKSTNFPIAMLNSNKRAITLNLKHERRATRQSGASRGAVEQRPACGQTAHRIGQDMIKIEPPQGEPLRRRALPGKSTTFRSRC